MLNKDRVDHILRAAGVVTGRRKFVLIGSAAIAAWRSDIPEVMAMSRDVDLFAYDAPNADEVSDMLDASLGQASPFDAEFGYYCDGVSRETALMPADWEAMPVPRQMGWKRSCLTLMISLCRNWQHGDPRTSIGFGSPWATA